MKKLLFIFILGISVVVTSCIPTGTEPTIKPNDLSLNLTKIAITSCCQQTGNLSIFRAIQAKNPDLYIADFLCVGHRMIIEVDGGVHDERQEYDRLRTKSIGDHDYRVMRFKNEEVLQELPRVLRYITALTSRTP